MSDQPSEEKTLPPSEKKLRDIRRKGQVAKSTDLVTAMVMIGCTLCIVVTLPLIEARLVGLVDLVSRIYDQPFVTLWPRVAAKAVEVLALSVLPLICVTLMMVVLTNLVVMKGMIFASEPITPRPDNINPVAGVKRIFSMRGIVEFFKSLVKMVALLVAMLVVYREGLPALMASSQCGFSCLEGVFIALIQPLIITVLVAFILVGALDVLMQRWLFRRDQRMTNTEKKREQKDMHGDPQIRQARNRQRHDTGKLGGRIGLQHTSIMVGAGNDWLVGLRYVKGETQVPTVTCKASPAQAEALMDLAAETDLMVVTDVALAKAIGSRAANGEPVPEGTFQAVANILVATGLIER